MVEADSAAEAASDVPLRMALPCEWRLQTAYHSEAHPGFSDDCGRHVALPPAPASDAPPPTGADGDVLPSSTAERVWPGAFLLFRYLAQPHQAAALLGASVLE